MSMYIEICNKMPASTDSTHKVIQQLSTPTEKPLHYQYLKEFRCEQCPLFLQHKCTQHKPFTCFYWHFMNQRRRRPLRKRDGTFNYSPDVYCTKYDETTGLCPDGDECPYLHRTAGDTERRYHLRYYKTGICVYDTDSRGYCVKNGPHCAFAHGLHDLRNPVYDIRELQAMEGSTAQTENDPIGPGNGPNSVPNSLDKERNALNEDPRWQDTAYVLANYKTDICKRPPRLCRQGYACPQFHNNKDRRRSPKKFKYRSTPCPNVKQGDEWGDPANCDSNDQCPYCHTRTEQQFHPEIYKSTKCNDIQQTGYCPRGPFCAFAHVEKEISAARELSMDPSTDLSQLVSNVLPQSSASSHNSSPVSITTSLSRESGRLNYTSVASSLPDHFATGGGQTFPDLSAPQPPPGHMLMQRDLQMSNINQGPGPIARPRSYSTSVATNNDSNILSSYFESQSHKRDMVLGSMNGPIKNNSGTSSLFGGHSCGTSSPLFAGGLFYPKSIESVLSSTLDDLNLDDISMEASLDKEFGAHSGGGNSASNCDSDSNVINSVLSRGIGGPTPPVNIPGRISSNDTRHIGNLSSPPIGQSPLTSSLASGQSGPFGVSPFGPRSMYDLSMNMSMSPSQSQSHNSSIQSMVEIQRLREEVQRSREEAALHKATLANYEEKMNHAMNAWKHEFEDANRREKLIESQRDEALTRVVSLQQELEKLKSSSLGTSQSINDQSLSLSSVTNPLSSGSVSSSISAPIEIPLSASAATSSITNSSCSFQQQSLNNRFGDISHLPPSQLAILQNQLKSDLDMLEQILHQRQQNSA